MAWGKKLLQNQVVLHRMLRNLQQTEQSMVTQRSSAESRAGAREVPIIFSAVLTTA